MLFAARRWSVGPITVPAVAREHGPLPKSRYFLRLLAFSLATFVIWFIVTLAFGRIYCSTFCPLGIYQDLCSRLPRMRSAQAPPGTLSLFFASHFIAPHFCVYCSTFDLFLAFSGDIIFDPYSVFGRFGLNVVRPIWEERS